MNDAIEPQPTRRSVTIDESDESLRLSYRRIQWRGGSLLIAWLMGWTVGCVVLAGWIIRQGPQPNLVIITFMFWVVWMFVFGVVLMRFFQKEELSLGVTGAAFSRRVFIEIKRHKTPLDEIKQFVVYERETDTRAGRVESEYGIEMEAVGLPLEFAAGLGQPELFRLQDMLQQRLVVLRKRLHVDAPTDDLQGVDTELGGADAGGSLDGSRNRLGFHAPSDCRWWLEDELDALTFRQRGRLSVIATDGRLLFLIVFNVVWNGVVSLLAGSLYGITGDLPLGGAWWGWFLFLIPLEAVGLLVLVTLVLALMEPVRRTTWRIGRSSVEWRLTWLDIGPWRDYPTDNLDPIEVRTGQVDRDIRTEVPWKSAGEFRLVWIDGSNHEVCSIDDLTEGEARWMAAEIRRQRPIWFRQELGGDSRGGMIRS
jgi:hypothetical protein